MTGFVLRRLVGAIGLLLAAALIVFLILDLLPADPVGQVLGPTATAERTTEVRAMLGLDQPMYQRLLGALGGMFIGNFGVSPLQGVPVGNLIAERLAVTAPLSILAMLLAVAIGVPAGAAAALMRDTPADRTVQALGTLGGAVPHFWLGMLLVLLFTGLLHWLPQGGFVPWTTDPLRAFSSLLLPALALALPLAATFAVASRAAVVRIELSDYVRGAEAIGQLRRDAVIAHAPRNVVLELLPVLGSQFGALIVASCVVENVFYLPGIGRLIVDAIAAHDLPVVRGALMVLIIAIAISKLAADLLPLWLDPRLKRGAA